MAFSEACRQEFSPAALFFYPPSLLHGFSQQNGAKIDAISALSNFFFFFFFCFPQLYLWGSPLLGEIFAYVTVF